MEEVNRVDLFVVNAYHPVSVALGLRQVAFLRRKFLHELTQALAAQGTIEE